MTLAALAMLLLAAPAQRTVIVTLSPRADVAKVGGTDRAARGRNVIAALSEQARASRRTLEPWLNERRKRGQVSRVVPLWVVNALSVTATDEVLGELARLPQVAAVTPDEVWIVPAALPAEPNVVVVQVPPLWVEGVWGQGAVVASLDSGVDASHPALWSRFRAGGWFDPYGQHATPIDVSGHGTWTMGVMVGGDAGGSSVGVAPGARWIAAKIFNDQGVATATAIHLAFQWVLDPDGDPTTADAPHVVNGSWSFGAPGCHLEFQPDLAALRAAGIVSVFAAGNAGPGASSSTSPGNYPQVFSVGSVDLAGALAWDSSRGPSACDGSLFPDVVAPGVDVVTTELFSSYAMVSGTSISAPHVSGVFALLAAAFPAATVDELEAALTGAAVDLGPAGPDHDFGAGRVDAFAAYQRLVNGAAPAPIALDDAYVVAEDTSATFSPPGVLGNDRGGATLSALLLSAPGHGTLTLSPSGTFSYTPAPDFYGVDLFTYAANDGARSSAAATVTVRVTAVNDAPLAVEDRATLTRVAPVRLNVVANDLDVDGRVVPATVMLASPPLRGRVTVGPGGMVVYTPPGGFLGSDRFTYVVFDDRGARSNPAVVWVDRR